MNERPDPPAAIPLSPVGIVAPPGFVIVTPLVRSLPEGFVKGTGMFDFEVCDEDA